MSIDQYFFTPDNVRLHWRDHPGDPARPALLCLPGLTRNMRDFAALAGRMSPRHRVVTVSFRGRGDSGYARDPLTYVPFTYLSDLNLLVQEAGLERFAVIGTSLGGLMGLMLGMTQRPRLAGLLLNDVGPELEAAGLLRIRQQLGRGGNWVTWLHAARDLAQRQADIYPDWQLPDWLAHAKRLCRVTREGRIDWDYDAGIATPFQLPHSDDGVDFRAALAGFAGQPVLSLRGGLSDVLAADAQQRMRALLPGIRLATIPRVGHAPTLDEPEAAAAIESWLETMQA